MMITHFHELSETSVTHHPEIKKKVMIANGSIPHLTQFAQTTFKPGQGVDNHVHESMIEVFYIVSGKAEFVVEGKKYEVRAGDTITIPAGEYHYQHNPYSEDTTWIYFGIETT